MRRPRSRGGASSADCATLVFLSCACLASVAGGEETSSASGTPKSAPTLLVSFDGFRASYLDAQDPSELPELTALWRGGVRAALRPRFISKTFPNHYSLVTGLNEQTHGIVANRFFDPDANASFTPASRASFWWDGGEPLWVTARRDERDARVYFWPGSESEIRGVRPTEYRAYEKTESFDARVDAVAAWIADAARRRRAAREADTQTRTNATKTKFEEKHPFFAVYFEEPDASGHAHGPRANETKAAARRVDDALRRLRVSAGSDAWAETNVIVVSDHGMAELAPGRAVFLADEPCAVPFRDVHVEGSDVVMHVWPRLLKAARDSRNDDADDADDAYEPSFPADPADPRADPAFDAAALAARVRACHPNVSAWTRDAVPSRFAYGGNRRVGPVVIAADVGWTLCGANASARAAATAPASAYAHERDWSAEHSACVASLRAEAGHRGAHGFDNDAPEMRAVFVARGPSFRKDGARLVVARDGDSETATALTGRDADAAVSESVDNGGAGTDLDAVAAAWEPRTFVFDNTAVFSVAARALGLKGRDDGAGSVFLKDGRPFPRVDGVLRASVADALFDVDGGGDDAKAKKKSKDGDVVGAAGFFAAAAVSFAAFHLLDRRATGRWPFEKRRALLPLDAGAEQQLPEMEMGGVETHPRRDAPGDSAG